MLGNDIFIINNDLENKSYIYAPIKGYCECLEAEYDDVELEEHLNRINHAPLIEVKSFDTAEPELALALTEICNMKCKYCYANGGRGKNKHTMNKERIDSVLGPYFKALHDLNKKTCTIKFDGGCEATCAPELLKYSVRESKALALEYNIEVGFGMATNGFFNKTLANYISEIFDSISLSFDGPEDIQNFQRPQVSGAESFKCVYETAQILYRSNLNLSFHVVVTHYNVNRLEETLTFFEKHFPGARLVLATMDANPFCNEVKPPDQESYIKALETLKNKSYNLNWMSTDKRAMNGLKSVFCASISKPNWYVTTKGRINACMRDTHSQEAIFDIGYYDDVRKEMVFDAKKLSYLKSFNIYDQSECQNCFAKYLCGGGCPFIRETSKQKCDIIRNEAKTMIFQEYKQREMKKCFQELFANIKI